MPSSSSPPKPSQSQRIGKRTWPATPKPVALTLPLLPGMAAAVPAGRHTVTFAYEPLAPGNLWAMLTGGD